MASGDTKKLSVGLAATTTLTVPGTGKAFAYTVSVVYQSDGASLSFEAMPGTSPISILELVSVIANTELSGEQAPGSIFKDIKISAFSVVYSSGPPSGLTISLKVQSTLGGIFQKDADLAILYSKKGDTGWFSGSLLISGHRFGFEVITRSNEYYIISGYEYKAEGKEVNGINFADIVGVFVSRDTLRLPDLTLNIKRFHAFFVYKGGPEKQKAYAAGAGAGISGSFDLSGLPLIGPLLAEKKAFELDDISVSYASGPMEPGLKKGDTHGGGTSLVPGKIASGFGLIIAVKAGGEDKKFTLGDLKTEAAPADAPGGKKEPGGTGGTGAPGTPSPSVPSPAGGTMPGVKWFDLKYQAGPFTFQRVGLLYDKGKVIIFLDAMFSLSVIEVQVIGLGLGFELKWPPEFPEFYLQGLGITFRKDPVEISGIFVKTSGADPNRLEFYGAVMIRLSRFTVAAIGGYSQTRVYPPATERRIKELDTAIEAFKAKNPGKYSQSAEYKALDASRREAGKDYTLRHSLFIYGVYMGPIGGPAFFFVNGLAAGFGYNRRIRTPRIEEVKDFPLVSLVLSARPKKIGEVLQDLIDNQWIPESPGDYWFAIGIKFTSFKLIDAFILVIVQFGTRTEFTILGLAILAWPTRELPIAFVELALKINFGPDADFVSVEAMITENSYLFDRNCRLTGGFAFYAWVSGPYCGDFVVTLGGYHPKFQIPAHYPRVERVGLNWQLSNKLSIKGGFYFALTPSSIMAGGSLEILFDIGFLKAFIRVWVDMIIAWAPARYELGAGIIVRIQATLNLLFISKTFSIEFSAYLNIWGPPFAGRAVVDWSFFSFTISFGDTAAQVKRPLEWPAFRQQFLPSVKKGTASVYNAAEIQIKSGILRDTANDPAGQAVAEHYVLVNPHNLVISIEAPLPLTGIFNQANDGRELEPSLLMETPDAQQPISYGDKATALGIRPMIGREGAARAYSALKSQLTLNAGVWGNPAITTFATSVPEALWGNTEMTAANDQPEQPKVIPRALKGLLLRPGARASNGATSRVDVRSLVRSAASKWVWARINLKMGMDNVSELYPKQKITGSINDNGILRSDILSFGIMAQGRHKGAQPWAVGDVQGVVAWVEDLEAIPLLCETGYLPQKR